MSNERKPTYRTPGPELVGARHPDLGVLEPGKAYPADFPVDPKGQRWLACDAQGNRAERTRPAAVEPDAPAPVKPSKENK